MDPFAVHLAALLLGLSCGCAGSVSDADEGATPLGEWCPADSYCVGDQVCADLSFDTGSGTDGTNLCTVSCADDSDCVGLDAEVSYRCGQTAFRRVCLPDPCAGDHPWGVYCEEGRVRTCATDPHCRHCNLCGLLDEYEWCDLETGECVPKADIGEPCEWDYQCRSESCSPDEGVCSLATSGP